MVLRVQVEMQKFHRQRLTVDEVGFMDEDGGDRLLFQTEIRLCHINIADLSRESRTVD